MSLTHPLPQAAAAVEQRRADAAAALHEAQAAAAAGAALDGKAAPAQEKPGARHEALRLALLKYKVQGLWPGSAVQQLCFERLLGQAPALEVSGGGVGVGASGMSRWSCCACCGLLAAQGSSAALRPAPLGCAWAA